MRHPKQFCRIYECLMTGLSLTDAIGLMRLHDSIKNTNLDVDFFGILDLARACNNKPQTPEQMREAIKNLQNRTFF